MAQQQIIFKANLPALGFNTYYFEKKSMFYPQVLKRTFSFPYIASEERNTKSTIEITQNEACLLQNQVRQ
jgi:hypothetical protein